LHNVIVLELRDGEITLVDGIEVNGIARLEVRGKVDLVCSLDVHARLVCELILPGLHVDQFGALDDVLEAVVEYCEALVALDGFGILDVSGGALTVHSHGFYFCNHRSALRVRVRMTVSLQLGGHVVFILDCLERR